jgi:hypothetical protein
MEVRRYTTALDIYCLFESSTRPMPFQCRRILAESDIWKALAVRPWRDQDMFYRNESPDHNCCFHEHLLQSLCCSSTFAGLHISGSDFDIVHLAQSPQILYECMAGQFYAHSPKEWQLTNSVNSLVIDVPLFCVNCSLLMVKPINRESLPIDRRHSNIASESIPFGGELLKSYRERSSHRRRVK